MKFYKPNSMKSFGIIIGTLLFAILLFGINAGAVEQIEAYNGNWQIVVNEEFPGQAHPDYRYATKTIELPVDTTKVRVTQSGTDTAHLDMALLDGKAPVSVIDKSTDIIVAPAKLAQADYDVINADSRTIEITWTESGSSLILAAVEEDIIGDPYILFKDGYLSYTPNEPETFSQFIVATSSHPASTFYATVSTTSEELNVYLDATGDNTLDLGGDWANLHVVTPDGIKEFKIDDSITAWGTSTFEYTTTASWEHKTYLFNIPLEEIGLSQNDEIQFQISYYGTSVQLVGTVLDACTKEPVENANVTYLDIPISQYTNPSGNFIFPYTASTYNIRVEKTGYETYIDDEFFHHTIIYLNPIGGCSTEEIPEFPTIALPIVAILGLTFLIQRRKGK